MTNLPSHNDDARAIIRHVLACDDANDIGRVARMLDCKPTQESITTAFEGEGFLTGGLWQWLQEWANHHEVRLKGE